MEIRKLDSGEVLYPIFGTIFVRDANYLEKVVCEIIRNTNKKDKITLIARGTSGAICCGYVISGLYNAGYSDVKVILSRKHVTHHDYPRQEPEGIVIFVDDIIETGLTLASVVEEYGHINYAFCSTNEIDMQEYISKRNYELISQNIDYLYLGY